MSDLPMNDRLCITGLGVVSPIGIGKEEFLFSLKNGRSGIEEIKEFDTHFSRSKKGGTIRSFRPKDFISAGKIRRLDRASQFAIAASKLALADAGFSVTAENSRGVGVVLGSGFCGLSSSEEFHRTQVLKGFLDLNPMLFPNTVPNAPSSYVSIELGIQGVNSTLVQSFCTAEAAICFACDQLRKRRADLILAGGVDELSEFLFRGFSELHLLATDPGQGEKSCPYDRMRNGLVLGEGAGLLVLEREEHVRSRGGRIYGYILGYSLVGESSGGDPSKDLARSIGMVLKGKEDIDVDYLGGAGNSSPMLDALEAKGVKEIFQTRYPQIPVSSIKSMTGEAIASGGMRMVANVLSMENSFIPPTINYLNPDPACDLHYVSNEKRDREIRTVLHLGISPENCYSSLLVGAEWNG
ncbi:MAG TPA: beta-ketoacyl-[acyl-carrier-protein] synthase family protein [Thermodesulfobacteriota bacterium]|nr:beta-ketoacyl-[acyl-carrier-protein] synthase family protein [Thermodesulfobacteriota bacterium]